VSRRPGGFKSPFGRAGEEENLVPLPEIEPQFPGCPFYSLVPIPTHNFQLLKNNEKSAIIYVNLQEQLGLSGDVCDLY
jgi:hypothetical protein